MTRGVGDFAPKDAPLIEVYGGARGAPSTVAPDRLRGLVALGRERTIDQDPAFALRILVDIAIRALSPAVNDPTTAVQVLDYVEDLLRALAQAGATRRATGVPSSGVLTVPVPGWDEYVALAITEIRHYGVTSPQVCRRLRALLEDLRDDVAAAQQEAIEAQLRLLSLAISQAWPEPTAQAFARSADRQGIGEGGAGTVAPR